MRVFQLSLFSALFILLIFVSADCQEKFGIDTSSQNVLGGLMLGETAPDFEGADQNGYKIILSNELEKGPVLIVFYRGYWCSYCNNHLGELEKELEQLSKKGIQIIAITPETVENVSKTLDKTQSSIKILMDRDETIMKDYKVYFQVTQSYQDRIRNHTGTFLVDLNAQDTAALPVPATYLISRDQKVSYVHYDPDYSKRSSVADILLYFE